MIMDSRMTKYKILPFIYLYTNDDDFNKNWSLRVRTGNNPRILQLDNDTNEEFCYKL